MFLENTSIYERFDGSWYFRIWTCLLYTSRGVSTLYSLADFMDEDGVRIRKDESYEKNYLIGKYGAMPTLKSIDMFKEDWAWQKRCV